MSLVNRLDKIAAALAAKNFTRQEIVRRIFGVEDTKVVLDRMVADGEITEAQRGDVRFIRTIESNREPATDRVRARVSPKPRPKVGVACRGCIMDRIHSPRPSAGPERRITEMEAALAPANATSSVVQLRSRR